MTANELKREQDTARLRALLAPVQAHGGGFEALRADSRPVEPEDLSLSDPAVGGDGEVMEEWSLGGR